MEKQDNNEEKRYLKLNDVEAYKTAFHLSNYVWNLVVEWQNFSKDTIGKQFVRAVDSISANIAEGVGRHHKKDKIRFFIIARASAKECLDWNEKAKVRKLMDENKYKYVFSQLNDLPRQINYLIKITKQKLSE
ncbi:four helix bundle protein [Thermoflexibacter ruber]|uniref:Four helix bundle protein n=1 Tax=Thermoflexibacter ruber TaxID=1003 RepID=A0A1I2HSY8_9BACT|nr:four helix bundle protein [Thermoflexibacter ruber]SFF33184.1 four helix bundle protein [Thermoflexibacter ruber]